MQTKLLFFIFFILSHFTWSQDLGYSKIIIEEIKAQLKEESKKFINSPDLNSSQNEILKKKHQQKVDAELAMLKPELIIVDGELYNRVYKVFEKVIKSNPSIPQNTRLVIYRTNDFNAFTLGDNIVFVNLGLLFALKNEDQLTLVISHEIAHNTLQHVEQSMVKAVIRETDKELKSEVNSILKTEYGKVTALNELLLPRILESREISRNHEFEADSLGFIYFKNTNYNLKKAFSLFHTMEKQTKNLSDSLEIGKILSLDIYPEIASKYNEYSKESSLGTFVEKDDLKPYLATHPYDRQRFVRLTKLEKVDTLFENYKPSFDSTFAVCEKIINHEIIANAFAVKNISQAIFYSIKHLESFPDDQVTLKYLSLSLGSLSFFKDRRLSGRFIDRQNPKNPEDYDRICAFSYSLTPSDCLTLSAEIEKRKQKEENNDACSALTQLIFYLKNEQLDNFKDLWFEKYPEIYKTPYAWILTEIENHLYNTKKLSYIKTKIK